MDYKKINRRNFIKQSALASASLAFTFSKISASTKKVSNLRGITLRAGTQNYLKRTILKRLQSSDQE